VSEVERGIERVSGTRVFVDVLVRLLRLKIEQRSYSEINQ